MPLMLLHPPRTLPRGYNMGRPPKPCTMNNYVVMNQCLSFILLLETGRWY